MNRHTHPERFHALDATRAFALLLGVVFHIVWAFGGTQLGSAVADPSGGPAGFWFFFTSHTFRMQLFFLIAGFFAHMVCHRRGFASFARNRLVRIGIPLLAGWLILFPLIVLAFVAGANVSGRNLTEFPLIVILPAMFLKGLAWVPQSSGGMFGLGHLWFLYYLALFCILVPLLRHGVTRFTPVANRLRKWSDTALGATFRQPAWLLVWAGVTGVFLWRMSGWFGVDTPAHSLVPSVPVLIFYGFFFAFGWILHRQAHLLGGLARHWHWQIALGLLLSIPLFTSFKVQKDAGTGGFLKDAYPRLSTHHVPNWPEFVARLLTNGESAQTPIELSHFRAHLSQDLQDYLQSLSADINPDQQAGLCKELNKMLGQPGLFEAISESEVPVASPMDHVKTLLQNRLLLEKYMAGSLIGDPRASQGYSTRKLVYSMGYALVMWLFLFGTLGAFQAHCHGHSPVWRYLADSSYWVYLAHLPLVAALQVWIYPWDWHAIPKILLITALSFLALLASYHYLVRSTFIGRILNGKAHPFHANPWKALQPETETHPQGQDFRGKTVHPVPNPS